MPVVKEQKKIPIAFIPTMPTGLFITPENNTKIAVVPKRKLVRAEINQRIGEGVTKLDDERVKKLKEAFAIDATVAQACAYAEITTGTYYNWIHAHPELLHEFDAYRERLTLKAKQNLAMRIHSGDTSLSRWQVERKEPTPTTTHVVHSGGMVNVNVPVEDKQAVAAFHDMLKENMRKRSQEKAREAGEIT